MLHANDYRERIDLQPKRTPDSPESRFIEAKSVSIEEYPFQVSIINDRFLHAIWSLKNRGILISFLPAFPFIAVHSHFTNLAEQRYDVLIIKSGISV